MHQHMIDQFWSPRVNKRTDGGGSFEGREVRPEVLRRCAEVGERLLRRHAHLRRRVPPTACPTRTMKRIAKYYSDTGMLDFIGVVGSGCDTHTLANVIPNTTFPPEPFLHLAAGIKGRVDVPVLFTRRTSRTRTRPRASSKAAT